MTGSQALAGRAALVTGAGAEPGRTIALALAAAGAAVLVNDVNPDRAEDVAEAITAQGGRALAWVADVSNKFQVGSMIERLRDEFGGLHLVVNAWAVNKRGPLLKLDEYDWRRVLEVNLTGAFFVSQLAARVMTDEGGGVFVQLLHELPADTADQTAFAVSQGGLRALVDSLAAALEAQGVRVAAVPVAADAEPAQVAAAVLAALD